LEWVDVVDGGDQWLSLAMKAMVDLQMMDFFGVGGVDVD